MDAVRRTSACRRNGPSVFCTDRLGGRREAGMGLYYLYCIFLWIYIGKYPIDTYRYSVILESGGAYQDIDHPAGFCKSGLLNLFSVCDSNGIFFRGITGCCRG